MDAEASRSPQQVGISLSDDTQDKLRAYSDGLVADVAESFRDNLTKHAATQAIEIEQLREDKEQLQKKMIELAEANKKLRARLGLPEID